VLRGNKLAIFFVFALGFGSAEVLAADSPPETPSASTTNPDTSTPPTSPTASPETSRADALFEEGKLLMEQKKFVEACDKLAESDALDPAIGTLGLLATCHEQQGRIATAWREYNQTAARAEAVGDDRGAFARERSKALEAELPKLLVRLVVVEPNVVVLRNGVRILPEEFGVATPMDPGTYEIVARYPNKPEFRTTVTVSARKVAEVEIPNPTAPIAKTAESKLPLNVVNSGPISGQKIGAIVAGGIGVVGLGLGAAFGISAASKNSASIAIRQSCNSGPACEEGKQLRQEAFAAATVANVGVGIGLVGVGTAVVLALLPNHSGPAGSKTKEAQLVPWVAPNGGGALFVGHF